MRLWADDGKGYEPGHGRPLRACHSVSRLVGRVCHIHHSSKQFRTSQTHLMHIVVAHITPRREQWKCILKRKGVMNAQEEEDNVLPWLGFPSYSIMATQRTPMGKTQKYGGLRISIPLSVLIILSRRRRVMCTTK